MALTFRQVMFATLVFAGLGGLPAQEHVTELRALQPKIDSAIDRGVAWLVARQLPDGSWRNHAGDYPNGQTSLSVYTLLKCGLDERHPAVRRGLNYLRARMPVRTYSIALQMMAYQATGNRDLVPEIEKLLAELVQWQERPGGFGYPGHPGDPSPPARGGGRWEDLSNSQYAALGMRAAMMAGLKVPRKELLELVERTLDHQTSQERLNLPPSPFEDDADGYARTPPNGGSAYGAGFTYHPSRGRDDATGSMTTAGLGILLAARDALGKDLPRAVDKQIQSHVTLGLNWLRTHWAVDGNPTPNPAVRAGWHYYYLYGLERVGSLLLLEIMAGHPWYLEGARLLVSQQRGGGEWAGGSNDESDTCFALLFLKRATFAGRATGESHVKKGDQFTSEGGSVRLRGSGNPDLAVWVEGFTGEVLEKWKVGLSSYDLRILEVAYLVNDIEVAKVEGDVSRPWRGESYASRYMFPTTGKFSVRGKVTLLPPGATRHDADTELIVLETQPFTVEVKNVLDIDAEAMLKAVRQNILLKIPGEVTATSEVKNYPGSRMIDGREGTAWVSDPTDKKPQVVVAFKRNVTASHLVLSQWDLQGGSRSKTVEVEFQGHKQTYTVEMRPDGRPTALDLGGKVSFSRLRLTFVGYTGDRTGLAELYLY